MELIKALSVELEQDLRPLSQALWQRRIPHRVSEQGGQLVIWVLGEAEARQVRALHSQWQQGRLEPVASPPRPRQEGRFRLRPAPLTLLLVVLSVLGFFIARLDTQLNWLSSLTFFEYDRHGDSWIFTLPAGQYWRLFTPVFLHFSLLHIVFNGLWLWEFGGRVEHVQGSGRLLVLVLLMGVGSNLAQALFAEVGIFGGMSGVIYGLLGYCWIWARLSGDARLRLPGAITGFMLAWLVLSMMGFSELLGLGAVANAAHVGGLVMGLVLGAGGAWLSGARRRL